MTAVRTTSLFVPSTSLAGIYTDAANTMATAPVVRRTTASTTRRLGAEAGLDAGDEDEEEEDDAQMRAVLGQVRLLSSPQCRQTAL